MSNSNGMHRVKGKKITKKIIIGSKSYPMAEKPEDNNNNNSHIWTVYLKPYYDEDLTRIIRKVQFTLHESYATPIREVLEPPYEITESGWGEFEIIITIFFVNNVEKSVNLYHVIRLFSAGQKELPSHEKPLISEYYEELVFIDPPEYLYNNLIALEEDSNNLTFQHYSNWDTIIENTKQLICNAQDRIMAEIASTKLMIEEARNVCNLSQQQFINSSNTSLSLPVETTSVNTLNATTCTSSMNNDSTTNDTDTKDSLVDHCVSMSLSNEAINVVSTSTNSTTISAVDCSLNEVRKQQTFINDIALLPTNQAIEIEIEPDSNTASSQPKESPKLDGKADDDDDTIS